MPTPPPPSIPRPTRPWRHSALRWALGVLAGLALLVGAFVLWLVAAFSGGLDSLLDHDVPREGDPEVEAALEESRGPVDAEADGIAQGAVAAIPEARRAGRAEVLPPCDEGFHDWKRDDPYDLLCDVQRVEVLVVPHTDAFREDMTALDQSLADAGWSSDTAMGMDRVLGEYWDSLASADTYSMADLPSARYGADPEHSLEVTWVEPDSATTRITYESSAEIVAADGSPTTLDALVAAVPRDGYGVVLVVTTRYFEG